MIVKLNDKDNMSKKKKRQQPTKQDFINAISQLIQEGVQRDTKIDALAGSLDLAIKYLCKGDTSGYQEYVMNAIKEMEQKADNESKATGQNNTVANNKSSTD